MLFFFVSVKSQTVVSPGVGFYPQHSAFNNGHLHDSLSSRKWFFSSYRGLSTSVSFFKGGHASIFSAPLGLQLNRRLSNNWYAFANVSVAPSYISINPSYLGGFNKNFSNNPFQAKQLWFVSRGFRRSNVYERCQNIFHLRQRERRKRLLSRHAFLSH